MSNAFPVLRSLNTVQEFVKMKSWLLLTNHASSASFHYKKKAILKKLLWGRGWLLIDFFDTFTQIIKFYKSYCLILKNTLFKQGDSLTNVSPYRYK